MTMSDALQDEFLAKFSELVSSIGSLAQELEQRPYFRNTTVVTDLHRIQGLMEAKRVAPREASDLFVERKSLVRNTERVCDADPDNVPESLSVVRDLMYVLQEAKYRNV